MWLIEVCVGAFCYPVRWPVFVNHSKSSQNTYRIIPCRIVQTSDYSSSIPPKIERFKMTLFWLHTDSYRVIRRPFGSTSSNKKRHSKWVLNSIFKDTPYTHFQLGEVIVFIVKTDWLFSFFNIHFENFLKKMIS